MADEVINLRKMARMIGVPLPVLKESMLLSSGANVSKGMLELCKEHTLKKKGRFKHDLWRLETFMQVASTCIETK